MSTTILLSSLQQQQKKKKTHSELLSGAEDFHGCSLPHSEAL